MEEMIRNYVSRYIVPFTFESGDYEALTDFYLNLPEEDLKALGLPGKSRWTTFWEEKEKLPEMDIYPYLLEIWKEDREKLHNLGTSLVLHTDGALMKACYRTRDNAELTGRCLNLGLFLFRNGVGFVWYDFEFAKVPELSTYMDFQHDFKELARPHRDNLYRKTGRDTFENICMGEWLAGVLYARERGISFWTERKISVGEKEMIIPDKALLFQYLFLQDKETRTRRSVAFRVANGYDGFYHLPELSEGDLYEPFGNATFYAARNGFSYVVSNDGTNEDFFSHGFAGKFTGDYFFIYILLLYQVYSCTFYSSRLTKIPARLTALEEQEGAEKLEKLSAEISLFLVKSVYESVSGIEHQNGAYRYAKKRLCLEEDLKSLTIGLEALTNLEKEKRKAAEEEEEKRKQEKMEKKDRRLNTGLVIFGFLVVISAIVDAMNLVDWFKNNFNEMNAGHWSLLAVILAITLSLIFVLVKNDRKE